MRTRFWIYVFVLILVGLAVLLWHHPRQQAPLREATQEAVPLTNNVSMIPNSANSNVSAQPQSLSASPGQESDQEKAQRLVTEFNESHYQSIEFYGEVIDQYSNPVPNVKINMSILQQQISRPTASGDFPVTNNLVRLEQETGTDGRFEITGQKGQSVDIEAISKEGYEISTRAPNHFEPRSTSFENPAIFNMWKLEEKAQLVSGSKFWGIIPDGRIYTIDLLQGTKVESANAAGDLRIAVSRPPGVSRQDHYDWSFQITPIDGGIIETVDDFMYEAPENGYAPEYDFHLNASDTNWTYRVKNNFYIKTRGGQNYGRINLEVFAHYQNQGVLDISWSVNPSGSRNLQP